MSNLKPKHDKVVHGLYSSKLKMDLSNDSFGNKLVFNCTLA
jgi:hypothetical protein